MSKVFMRPTAYLLIQNLGTGLYEEPGYCLAELEKNSARAHMMTKKWEPKSVRIEASIVPKHPVCNDRALLWLDYGKGMLDGDCERFFYYLGTPMAKLRQDAKGNLGDSQKGIGRLAALSLNEKCLGENVLEQVKHGFHVFTRTAESGPIRYVPFIPQNIEEDGVDIHRFIDPTDRALGPLIGIRGTFTAIVIPNPVFKSHNEIYEAIKWFLPTESDKMFDLKIGGKAVQPPALETTKNLTWKGDLYRARIGLTKTGEEGGIWLCDSETGLRVASCMSIGKRGGIPDPLWYSELTGNIYGPGLIAHQNTARNSLLKAFLRSKDKDAQGLSMFMNGVVSPGVQDLIEENPIHGGSLDMLKEIAEMCNGHWGPPDEDKGPPFPPRTPGVRIDPVPGPPRVNTDGERKPPVKRYLYMKVENETYKLYYGQDLDELTYAQVASHDDHVIEMNIRGKYKSMPVDKKECREHSLMQIFNSIGLSKHPRNPYDAMRFANKIRGRLIKNPPLKK